MRKKERKKEKRRKNEGEKMELVDIIPIGTCLTVALVEIPAEMAAEGVNNVP